MTWPTAPIPFGLNVDLPHEQAPNPFVEKLYHHGTFFSRLHHFVQLSSAFVVMRGGIGTTLESLLVWQLVQVGHLKRRPLIMVGSSGRSWWSGAESTGSPRKATSRTPTTWKFRSAWTRWTRQ